MWLRREPSHPPTRSHTFAWLVSLYIKSDCISIVGNRLPDQKGGKALLLIRVVADDAPKKYGRQKESFDAVSRDLASHQDQLSKTSIGCRS